MDKSKRTNPHIGKAQKEFSPELSDVLRRNGMRAALAEQSGQALLVVQSHDSRTVAYPINDRTADVLSTRGGAAELIDAYDTFNSVIGKKFRQPYNLDYATISSGKTVLTPGRTVVSWQPRPSLYAQYMIADPTNRIALQMLSQDRQAQIDQRRADFRAERFGYYDTSNDLRQYLPFPESVRPYFIEQEEQDLWNLLEGTTVDQLEKETFKVSANKVIPVNSLIPDDKAFTEGKWLQALSSHGITIDTEKKLMAIHSTGAKYDVVYDVRDEEMRTLANPSLTEASYEQRISVINQIIDNTYAGNVTMDQLNSNQSLNMPFSSNELARLSQMGSQSAVESINAPSQTIEKTTEGGLANCVYLQREEPLADNVTPYSQIVTSDVYFSGDKWLEALRGHGIDIDPDWGRMVIQPANSDKEFVFQLSAGDLFINKNDSLKDYSLSDRLYFINNVLDDVFADKVTLEQLDSDKQIALQLRPEAAAELERRAPEPSVSAGNNMSIPFMIDHQGAAQAAAIAAPGLQSVSIAQKEQAETKSKYTLTLVINDQHYTGEISQRQLSQLKDTDDYHRLRFVDHHIKGVDIDNLSHEDTTMLLDQLESALMGTRQESRHVEVNPALYVRRQEESSVTTAARQSHIVNAQALASQNFDRLMSESENESRGYKI